MKQSLFKKILCVIMCASLISLSACSGTGTKTEETTTQETEPYVQQEFTDTPGSVTKSETVYLNISNTGAVNSTLVTDWLHTDKAGVRVEDISPLEDIKNIKSNILPVQDGENLVWNMDTTDLYYSGATSKPADIQIDIQYTLDGVSITPEDLAGKTGHVQIIINPTNNGVKDTTINGVAAKIYNPLLFVGGFILPENGFSGTSITGGKLIGDGTKQIAVMAGVPGLSETLGLSAEQMGQLSIDLSGTYTIDTDVSNFTLGNMLFAAIPLNTLSLELGLSFSLDDVKQALGYIGGIRDTLLSLNADELIKIFTQNPERFEEIGTAVTDAITLYNENKVLIDVFSNVLTSQNLAAVQKLFDDLQGVDIAQLTELMNNPVFKVLFKNLPVLAQDLEALTPVVDQINEGLNDEQVKAALKKMPQTVAKLSKLQGIMEENSDIFTLLSELLSNESIKDLKTQITALSSYLNTDELGEQLMGMFNNSEELIDRLNAWLAYSQEYSIFTSAAQGTSTNVMFIYETPSITA